MGSNVPPAPAATAEKRTKAEEIDPDRYLVLSQAQTEAYCLTQIMPQFKKQMREAAKQLNRVCKSVSITSLSVLISEPFR